jgi:hypothetical protein
MGLVKEKGRLTKSISSNKMFDQNVENFTIDI